MQGQTNKTIRAERRPQALRNNPTDAETRLWPRLRQRQIDGCKFRRQHPYGDYILDFVCLERKVAVELDGGQHADAANHDGKRTRFLEQAGFVVLRFWNNEVLGNIDGVLEVILRTLQDRAEPPPLIPTQPSP
jgi:very-short-patch-repair endonuclease